MEGSHKGAGLGLRFLKHIERTRLFVYVVDLSSPDPLNDLQTVRAELTAYDPLMTRRAGVVAANKIDIEQGQEQLAGFKARRKRKDFWSWP